MGRSRSERKEKDTETEKILRKKVQELEKEIKTLKAKLREDRAKDAPADTITSPSTPKKAKKLTPQEMAERITHPRG
jgi:hypothetical protein